MNRASRRAWCASILLCASQWGHLASGAAPDALTLRDAIERAVLHNPAVAALVPEAESARQQSITQALRPATLIEAQLENFAGTGDASGANILETTLQLSHVVELGGKAAARQELGTTSVERLQVSHRARRADIFAEVARRFVHVLADQEHLLATMRATAIAERARDAVAERMSAGATSRIFLSRAEIALARARIEQEHAEHELASSRVALAALWGESEAAFPEVRGELFSLPNLERIETYFQRLNANPELHAFAAQARLLDARGRLARAQQSPNVTFSAGVRRLEAFDDQALIAGFSMPLGSRRRNASELATLQAERELLEFNRRSRELELKATLFALYQEILHARTEALALRNQIRPQAQSVLDMSEAGYRAGRFSLLDLTDAQQQLLDIERDAIRAAAEFHTHLIEIERITGEAVHMLSNR